MSLPDHTEDSSAAAAAAQPETELRHLHAVDPIEDTTEIPAITDDLADEIAAVQAAESSDATTAEDDGRWAATLMWLRAAFTPDSGLYTDRPPAVDEIVRRAKSGAQLPENGPLRAAGKAHGYLAAGNKIAVRTWEWIVDHPARLSVFVVLLGLAVIFPATRHLLGYLLTPVTWAQQALLD